ncbi:MAG: fasciclin domain-containing protein [Gemmatimonadetes bacterium]|nr:fasciclin domain-containing protein [Gemmatimonadota bacterium]
MRGILKFTTLGILVLSAAACSDEATPFALEANQDRIPASKEDAAQSMADMTIAERVVFEATENDEFEALLDAVLGADPAVLETLGGRGQFTVFAPTDDAFDALFASGALDGIEGEALSALLTEVLLYHVSKGANDASEVLAKDQIRMLNGEFARIDGAMAMINDANITMIDIEAKNGIIHVIDAVLLPSGSPIQGNKNQSTILDLVEASAAAAAGAEFTLLKAAIDAASPEIAETLDGNGQFTVFAPTDAAFLALIAELPITAEELLANQPLLDAVLLYHVTRGRLYAADVTSKTQIRMLDGNRVSVDGTVLNDKVNIDLAGIDIEARNGVIHIIDAVLLPPM